MGGSGRWDRSGGCEISGSGGRGGSAPVGAAVAGGWLASAFSAPSGALADPGPGVSRAPAPVVFPVVAGSAEEDGGDDGFGGCGRLVTAGSGYVDTEVLRDAGDRALHRTRQCLGGGQPERAGDADQRRAQTSRAERWRGEPVSPLATAGERHDVRGRVGSIVKQACEVRPRLRRGQRAVLRADLVEEPAHIPERMIVGERWVVEELIDIVASEVLRHDATSASRCRRAATPPVLERLDGAGSFAKYSGDLFDREIGDEPQREHVALIGGEAGEDVGDPVLDTGQGFSRAFVLGDGVGQRIGQRDGDDPTLHAAVLVDQEPARDREHPRDEPGLFPVEVAEMGEHAEEHLAGQVFGIASTLGPQEARARVPPSVRTAPRTCGVPRRARVSVSAKPSTAGGRRALEREAVATSRVSATGAVMLRATVRSERVVVGPAHASLLPAPGWGASSHAQLGRGPAGPTEGTSLNTAGSCSTVIRSRIRRTPTG